MSKLAERLQTRFLKFAGSSLISTAVDQVIAWTLFAVLKPYFDAQSFLRIFIATLVARVCSVAVNFAINQRQVFAEVDAETGERVAQRDAKESLPRFIACAALILVLSSIGVWVLHAGFGAPEGPAKLVVDLCLFFLNYTIQRRWVFKPQS